MYLALSPAKLPEDCIRALNAGLSPIGLDCVAIGAGSSTGWLCIVVDIVSLLVDSLVGFIDFGVVSRQGFGA